jgi:hypothetical protein
MNRTPKARDPLEAELESLRPAALPAELVARIASELEEPLRSPRFRLWWIPAAAAVAACVAIAAAVWRAKTPGPGPVRTIVDTMPVAPPNSGAGEDLPALATYHRALAGPPAALDELLDRHAARSLSGGSRSTAGTGLLGPYDFNR